MDTIEQVTARIDEMDHAYARNDLDAYFGCFAPDAAVMVPGVGRITVDAYRGKWSGTIAGGGGVASSTLSDLVVTPSPAGDAAIATYVLDVVYRGMRPGAPADETQPMTLLMSEVWFHDGSWRLVHMDWSTRAAA